MLITLPKCQLTLTVGKQARGEFMKHCLPKRLYKDMCLLDFCKMKISVREATLTLQKPYSSARLRLLAVTGCKRHTVMSQFGVRSFAFCFILVVEILNDITSRRVGLIVKFITGNLKVTNIFYVIIFICPKTSKVDFNWY